MASNERAAPSPRENATSDGVAASRRRRRRAPPTPSRRHSTTRVARAQRQTASTASITRYSRRWLPIYGDDVIGRYHNAPYGSLPPHCFQEAEDAFSSLQKTRRNQAVVICGESGAGKTETTKLMLHYLAVVSKRQSARDAKLNGTTQHSGPTIAERMVASNPLYVSA